MTKPKGGAVTSVGNRSCEGGRWPQASACSSLCLSTPTCSYHVREAGEVLSSSIPTQQVLEPAFSSFPSLKSRSTSSTAQGAVKVRESV